MLVIRNNNGTGAFLYSKEGVTQGDPLSMFAYGIGILPLIRLLKTEFPAVEQPWYADDAGAGGKFDDIRRFFRGIQEIGPSYGYFPFPSKSILIVPQHNLEAAQTAFPEFQFEVRTGSRYNQTLGGSGGGLGIRRTHCDGCLQKFSVRHALECKTGGLVISRHNEIRDELSDLASKALSPSSVRDKPKIHDSCTLEGKLDKENKENPVKRLFRNKGTEDRGDILIRGLWTRGTDCIINVRITDVNAKSNRSKDPYKVLATQEREKKKKYLEACLEQRRHFSPFVVSTDGLLGKEAKTLLKKLSGLLAKKWEKPYSEVCGYVNA
jgi:hypothetical protein